MAPKSKAKAKAKAITQVTGQQGLKGFFGGAPKAAAAPETEAPKDAEMPPAAAAESAPAAAAVPQSKLSEEQMKKIQENREKALAKKRAASEISGSAEAQAPAADATSDPKEPAKEPVKEPAPSPEKTPTPAKATTPLKDIAPTPQKVSAAAYKRPSAPQVVAGSVAAARKGSTAETHSGKFDQAASKSWLQYNAVYGVRLEKLRGCVLQEAKSLWSGTVAAQGFVPDIGCFKKGNGKEIVLIGVLWKDLKSRPNVIEQYRKNELGLNKADLSANICSDKDVMWIEDTVMRLELDLSSDEVGRLATGVVAAVRGTATEDGRFRVTGKCFAKAPEPLALPVTPAPTEGPGPFLALMSGLMIGAPDSNIAARRRAIDFLTGKTDNKQLALLSSAVQRLIICGGVLASDGSSENGEQDKMLDEADAVFTELAAVMPVDLMPGQDDPTNLSLPQSALHPFLFRQVRQCQDFKCVSNPHECSVNGLRILGHSGQPVNDILRCTTLATPLDALNTTLEALHLAPTAPDTLATPPFTESDPFLIDQVPHVMFSGGHPDEAHSWNASRSGSTGTQCVCVPAFHVKPSIVLINLRDPKDVRVQEFGDGGEDVDMKDA